MIDKGNIEIDSVTEQVIGLAMDVHRSLGPGLLESAYEKVLAYELTRAGMKVETQKVLPLVYDEVELDAGYRLDMLVEDKVIIEIKSVESLTDVHLAQVLTYLKLSGCEVGLLMNFNVKLLKQGLRRVVNGYQGGSV